MKCPHGHHEIKLGYEKGSNAPYDKRCGIGIGRYKDVCRQAIAENKQKNQKIRGRIYLWLFITVPPVVYGAVTGSLQNAVMLLFFTLLMGLIIKSDINRNQRIEEKRREKVRQALNEFAQNHPGPPIKLIHTPKEVVEQRTEELVEETTEKLLKLL